MLEKNFMKKMQNVIYSAGDLILAKNDISEISQKEGHSNFVTKYDSMIQDYLIKHLGKLLPEALFLGEEDGQSEQSTDQGYVFIIDPIDGTTNFICDFQCSAICVGLAYNGEVIMGVVYNPFRDEMFWAEKGKGAFLNNKRITLSNKSLAEGVTIFDSMPYYADCRDQVFAMAKEVFSHTMDLREIGSAALSFCYAACGRAIIFAAPKICTWDYAAASIILKEAGGTICSFDGSNLKLRNKISVVGGTEAGVKELLEIAVNYYDKF